MRAILVAKAVVAFLITMNNALVRTEKTKGLVRLTWAVVNYVLTVNRTESI
jgi:hypothetical protein